jgi:hypothetical protein
MALIKQIDANIQTINKAIIGSFEKIDLRILLFIILCINLLSFIPSNNEEAYLPLAKQFIDPSWMPHSFMFNEWPGNRLIFQYITGFFLKYYEFEPFVFFARMAVFLFISIPVAAIFKKLEIKNIYAILVFQIYLLHQNYFAREFIFGDFEAKSIAYIFVMAGVYYLLNNKFLLAVLFSVLASYLHILVGGWFFVLTFIYSFFSTKSFNLLFKELLLFIILIMPFGYYLGKEIVHSNSVINGVNLDWVYVYFRNAHHLAPLSVKTMLPEVILQIGITGLLFLTTIFIFRKYKGELLNKLFLLNIIIFSMLFISLGISLVDKNGFFLKFYLFRYAALGCFMMYLYVLTLLKLIPKIPKLVKTGFFLIGFYLIAGQSLETLQDIFNTNSKTEYKELVNFVIQNTDSNAVFLNLDDYELSFSRLTRREEFVSYKLVPGGGQKIYEWYTRILERNIIANDMSRIQDLKKTYKLDFLISDHSVDERQMLKLVFNNKRFSLYKIL